MAEAVEAALQGDAALAVLTLLPIPESELPAADRPFRACLMDRFGTQREEDPALATAFARDVLAAYRGYWRAALLRPDQRDAYEARLLARLRVLTGRPQAADMDAVEPALRDRFARDGYRAELGRSVALRELVLRKDGQVASAGWRDYATCGRSAMR